MAIFRRKKNAIGAPHIKRRTAGTSNEISFDVLDAASGNYDEKGRNPKEVKISRPGKSVGVISLLFSKVHFPSKSEKTQSVSSISETTQDGALSSVAGGRAQADGIVAESGVANAKRASKTRSEKRAEKAAAKAERHRAKSVRGKHEIDNGTKAAAAANGSAAAKKAAAVESLVASRKEEAAEATWRVAGEPYGAEAALAEVERRKARRHKRRVQARIIGAVTCAALIGVAGWFAYQKVQLHKSQDAQFKSLVSDVSSVDENLVALDKLLLDPLDNEGSQDWSELQGKLDESKKSLQSTAGKAKDLAEAVGSSEMQSVINQVSVACDARVEMIESGEAIFAEAQKANAASASLQAVWDDVIAADAKAREGTSKLSGASIDEVTGQALDAMNEASSSFSEALQRISNLEESYQGLDLGAQREYLQVRIESLDYAIATANALASRDKSTAAEQAALYNSADQRAASLASSLPAAPSESVESAYEANVSNREDQYDQARRRATAADDVIRDYLGADSK